MGKAKNVMDNDWMWLIPPIKGGYESTKWGADQVLPKGPKPPGMPDAPPSAPEMQDQAIRNAKLAERRRQLGLAGRSSTWLTGARGDTNQPPIATNTLLGR